jgi:GTP-binding protein
MQIIEEELEAYGAGLDEKARLVVLNKIDQADDELVAAYREELLDAGADEVFAISRQRGRHRPVVGRRDFLSARGNDHRTPGGRT